MEEKQKLKQMRADQKKKEEKDKKDKARWKKEKRLSSFKMDADPLGTWAKDNLMADHEQIDEEQSHRSVKWNINMDLDEKKDLNELEQMEKL